MAPLKALLEWSVAAALLFLSSTLFFCYAVRGILAPTTCHRLQGIIRQVAKPFRDLFGG